MLIVSNGGAEDLIGARLALELLRLRPGLRLRSLPLVGEGWAYAGVVPGVGPLLRLPSGGFPFASLANLRADLRAGLIPGSLGQWAAARRAGRGSGQVVVVGDSYALMVGVLAAGAAQPGRGDGWPLTHLQPLVSALYREGMSPLDHLRELNALGANLFMPWEVVLGRRARRVYTRDPATARLLAARGVKAACRGSFAMDLLPPADGRSGAGPDPAGDEDHRPVLALLPGSRGDARESLPLMLEVASRLPGMRALVAWPLDWPALPPLPGWGLEVQGDGAARLTRGGCGMERCTVELRRGAFAATLRASRLALTTAGTAAEQAAGLGVPLVGFPTSGPQYTPGFARRQGRLLGAALTLCPPDVGALVGALERLDARPDLYRAAAEAGRERVGTAGALPRIAEELLETFDR